MGTGAANLGGNGAGASFEELPGVRPADGAENDRIVRKLFDALEQQRVRYCHWKSNIRLGETLTGVQDIDLLVDCRDAKLFQSVVLVNGFKLARSRSGGGHPGVFHALALDERTAEVVDLHAYYQLVSGDSLVKSYHFPVEDLLLEQTRTLYGVRIPCAEAELLLFLFRIILKHVPLIETLKINLHYHKITTELSWLREAAEMEKAEALARIWFPSIEPALFQQLLHAIADEGAVLRRVVLGRRVAWRLRKMRRLGVLKAMAIRFWRTLSFAIGRLTQRRDLMLLPGGAIVALVGPKATGKSTIAGAVAARLGRHLAVSRIHAGKPPATVLSFVPRLFMPVARKLLPHERLAEYEKPERRQDNTYSLFYVLRMTLLAYDRRKLLSRAFKAATSGEIVISDRYSSECVGAIDSSCFSEEALAKSNSSLKRWLMAKERELYQGLPRPRLVLRLVSPIDAATQRDAERVKPGGPDAEAVRRRWDLETRANFAGTQVVLIDTTRSLDETIRAAMRAVWTAL